MKRRLDNEELGSLLRFKIERPCKHNQHVHDDAQLGVLEQQFFKLTDVNIPEIFQDEQ